MEYILVLLHIEKKIIPISANQIRDNFKQNQKFIEEFVAKDITELKCQL